MTVAQGSQVARSNASDLLELCTTIRRLSFLDEPNSNLDDVGEQALIAALTDLRQRGKTIVIVTHRQNCSRRDVKVTHH